MALPTVAAFAAPGELDPSFGDGGKVVESFGSLGDDRGEALTLQADGKLVAAGSSESEFAIARYTPTGGLDTGFAGGDGVAVRPAATSANDVAIAPDGKIVAAGAAGTDWFITRLASDGSADPTFGNNGSVAVSIPDSYRINAIAIQPDRRIVAVGKSAGDFVVARFTEAGELDPSSAVGMESSRPIS